MAKFNDRRVLFIACEGLNGSLIKKALMNRDYQVDLISSSSARDEAFAHHEADYKFVVIHFRSYSSEDKFLKKFVSTMAEELKACYGGIKVFGVDSGKKIKSVEYCDAVFCEEKGSPKKLVDCIEDILRKK